MTYLDYAATAPMRPLIAQKLQDLCGQELGNPSSLHRAGRLARFHLEEARETCAHLLGAKVEEIVFCSGATEADNLAILGTLSHPEIAQSGLVTSALEHAAVFETAQRLSQSGHRVSWLEVSPSARVATESLAQILGQHPKQLVSVMACNNEVGSLQPVTEVAALCREHGAILHVDAVQNPQRAQQLIRDRQVDLLALSGHKMGGLPGGLLYVRQGLPLAPQILGGAQEDGRRAGTSEVLRAVSLGLALAATLAEPAAELTALRDQLESGLQNLDRARRLGPLETEHRAAHISSWLFDGLDAEPILAQLDLRGVCAGSGSACSSHAVEPSRVVKAMGYSDRQAMGLVRFSIGWKTTSDDIRRAVEIVRETVEKMMSKNKSKVKR